VSQHRDLIGGLITHERDSVGVQKRCRLCSDGVKDRRRQRAFGDQRRDPPQRRLLLGQPARPARLSAFAIAVATSSVKVRQARLGVWRQRPLIRRDIARSRASPSVARQPTRRRSLM
jgi:hypothetical protein